jgi:hypothetical protein
VRIVAAVIDRPVHHAEVKSSHDSSAPCPSFVSFVNVESAGTHKRRGWSHAVAGNSLKRLELVVFLLTFGLPSSG